MKTVKELLRPITEYFLDKKIRRKLDQIKTQKKNSSLLIKLNKLGNELNDLDYYIKQSKKVIIRLNKQISAERKQIKEYKRCIVVAKKKHKKTKLEIENRYNQPISKLEKELKEFNKL